MLDGYKNREKQKQEEILFINDFPNDPYKRLSTVSVWIFLFNQTSETSFAYLHSCQSDITWERLDPCSFLFCVTIFSYDKNCFFVKFL